MSRRRRERVAGVLLCALVWIDRLGGVILIFLALWALAYITDWIIGVLNV